jgi:uncharacterized phage protein gp47/JayE
MAFQIKNFVSIVAGAINRMRATTTKISDYNVGSVARSLIEAPAIEIESLYLQMLNGLIESIPVAVYRSFNFDRLPASAAYTVVTFTASPSPAPAAIPIPAGTRVRIPGSTVTYTTDAAVSIAQGGTTAAVRVTAQQAGQVGNTLAGTITDVVDSVPGVTVTNLDPVVSGRDEETDDQRYLRFQDFIRSIARSHIDGIRFAALSAVVTDGAGNVTEHVQQAIVYEPFITDNTQPLGYVNVWIWNGVDTASAALVLEAQKIIDGYQDASGQRVIGYKAAGVVVAVAAVTATNVNVTLTVTPEAGYAFADLKAPVEAAIRDYIFALPIGDDLLKNELIRVAMSVPGVYDIAISAPAGDTAAAINVKLLPGTIAASSA